MSTTEASSPLGKGDGHVSHGEAPETSGPSVPLELAPQGTQNDASKQHEDPTASDMNAEAAQEPQSPETGATATNPPIATQPLSSIPPQPEPPVEQMERLSIPANTTSESPPSSSTSTPPPPPPEKDDAYVKPATAAPTSAPHSIGDPESAPISEKELPDVPRDNNYELKLKRDGQGEGPREDNDSQLEIQSILGQFQDPARSTGQDEIMSPRMELAEQLRGAQSYFPQRKSSLDHMKTVEPEASSTVPQDNQSILDAPKHLQNQVGYEEPMLTRRLSASTAPPLPEPEPDQPFDFHRFLEQLRHRTADPVAKFLRSFLLEFGKRQWMVHEQVKIISDFLAFITNKMAICEVWQDVSDSEFDNAKEGMEKLVMNRLYSQTFSPAIPAPPTIPRSASRSRRKEIERLHGPWRRGQHQEDIERDDILAQKIRIYSWVSEEHLDIAPVSGGGRRFLNLAQQEILKINGYRAPRDKVICILNCCKVIFGLLKNSTKADTSADSFVPLLIYVVLHANPDHLVSNIQYILRFRNQEKLGGEAGYYLSSLSGAIQFIETLDRTSLTVSDEEFERNVEAAVSAIAQQNRATESLEDKPTSQPSTPARVSSQPPAGAGAEASRKEASQSTDDESSAPVAGLLRTIQKPLSTIGRMFSDEQGSGTSTSQQEHSLHPATTPQPPRLTHNVYQTPRTSNDGSRRVDDERSRQDREGSGGKVRQNLAPSFDAQDAAARQASAEDAEARRIQRAEHNTVVETLSNMFPNLDRDVIDDVVKMKEGRVGLAVDACLALSAE